MHTAKTKMTVAFDYILVVLAYFLDTSCFSLHLLMCTAADPSLLQCSHSCCHYTMLPTFWGRGCPSSTCHSWTHRLTCQDLLRSPHGPKPSWFPQHHVTRKPQVGGVLCRIVFPKVYFTGCPPIRLQMPEVTRSNQTGKNKLTTELGWAVTLILIFKGCLMKKHMAS